MSHLVSLSPSITPNIILPPNLTTHNNSTMSIHNDNSTCSTYKLTCRSLALHFEVTNTYQKMSITSKPYAILRMQDGDTISSIVYFVLNNDVTRIYLV